MTKYTEVKQMNFSTNADETLKVVVSNLSDVIETAAFSAYGKTGMVAEKKMDNYADTMQKTKLAVLGFAQKASGIKELNTKTDVAMAFANNQIFVSMFNSIIAESLRNVMVRATSPQLMALCNIETVEVGDSYSFDIDTKALPVAQLASYGDNVALLRGFANQSVTITPRPYSIGTTIDYIRILANDYDLGRELARVMMGMLYAQYKLVKNIIFATANVNNTPFLLAAFTQSGFVQMASDISMINGGAGVTAYGTLVAFNKIGALATTGGYGYVSQDEIIRNGYLQKIFGVDCVILDQATDFSAPFTTANAPSLRLIPDNYIVLVSTIGDKPVKLVREDFIRVRVREAYENSLNRIEYNYFQSFNAGLATQGAYGLVATVA